LDPENGCWALKLLKARYERENTWLCRESSRGLLTEVSRLLHILFLFAQEK